MPEFSMTERESWWKLIEGIDERLERLEQSVRRIADAVAPEAPTPADRERHPGDLT